MSQLISFVIFAGVVIIIMLCGIIITKNQWLAAFVQVLIKLAEKYINADGAIKMNFVTKMVLYLYQLIFKSLKLAIPSEDEIKEYCQKIYDTIQDQVNKIKSLHTKTTNATVNKIITEITEDKSNV